MRLGDIRATSIYTIHCWKDPLHFFRLTLPSPFEVSTGDYSQSTTSQSVTRYSSKPSSYLFIRILYRTERCIVTYLLHLIGRELKVKDLGVGNDSLLRYRLGDDNEALSNASATYTMEDIFGRTCWMPHLSMI